MILQVMRLLLIFVCGLCCCSGQFCPTTWASYAQVIERDFSRSNNRFGIKRETQYKCDQNDVFFRSRRALLDYSPGLNSCRNSELGNCTGKCNQKNVTITVVCNNFDYSYIQTLSYTLKNCDKLYWTGWSITGSCLTSRHRVYMRRCVDCDGNQFLYQNYCPGQTSRLEECRPTWTSWVREGCRSMSCNSFGQQRRLRSCLYSDGSKANNTLLCSNQLAIMIEQCLPTYLTIKNSKINISCQPSWSAWVRSDCFSVNCNSTGERTRTRKCLYGDGSVTNNTRLCLNQLSIITEQCYFNTSKCNTQKPNSTLNNFINYIIGGVAIVLLILVIVLLVVFFTKYKSKKFEVAQSVHQQSNDNNIPLPYEITTPYRNNGSKETYQNTKFTSRESYDNLKWWFLVNGFVLNFFSFI